MKTVATLPAPVGTFSRVAVLTDASTKSTGVGLEVWSGDDPKTGVNTTAWYWSVLPPFAVTNQLDPSTGNMNIVYANYLRTRGIMIRTDYLSDVNPGNSTDEKLNLQPVTSQIDPTFFP
jgi:hypothetical protein